MTPYRQVDPAPFIAALRDKKLDGPGPAPQLQWLPIAELVIDPSYQREVLTRGAKNIEGIALRFDWTKFGTVIVAPVPGGKYAIVDGQHRTTAAAARGIEQIPCQVIFAEPAKQAAAFAAINGKVTAITPFALHAARAAAGDAEAVRMNEVCASAGVFIARYPVPANKMKPGETLALGAIQKCLRTYGAEILSLALRCITQDVGKNVGNIRAPIIAALCNALSREAAWRADPARLLKAMAQFDVVENLDEAVAEARKRKVPAATVLNGYVLEFLEAHLGSAE